MDEDQYRSMYRSVNEHKCVFEKAINARHCNCSIAQQFNLADRQGIACSSPIRHEHCLTLLEQLRKNASFALHIIHSEGQLPHANEMKVQAGGLSGLQNVVLKEELVSANTDDIDGLLRTAELRFGQIESFPYTDIVKAIGHFKGRQRRKR